MNDNLIEIFKCYICLESCEEPHICPKCTKLCCEKCIKKWIRERKEECPHCRNVLNLQNIISCRFLTEVQKFIVTNPNFNKEVDICEDHETTQKKYFCVQCETPVCSDCLIFTEKHQTHSIKHLENVYSEVVKQMLNKLEKLTKLFDAQAAKLKQIEKANTKLQISKKEAENELFSIFLEHRNCLDNQLESKQKLLINSRTNIFKKSEFLLSKIEILKNMIENQSRVDILHEKTQVDNTEKELESFVDIDPDFSNLKINKDYCPQYEFSQICEVKYSKLCKGETFKFWSNLCYSKWLFSLSAITDKKEDYISMIINPENNKELLNFLNMYIKVEMLSSTSHKKIMKEKRVIISENSSLGFEKFCKTEILKTKGFIKKDSLRFLCSIRFSNFEQKCIFLERYCNALDTTRKVSTEEKNEARSTIDIDYMTTQHNQSEKDEEEDNKSDSGSTDSKKSTPAFRKRSTSMFSSINSKTFLPQNSKDTSTIKDIKVSKEIKKMQNILKDSQFNTKIGSYESRLISRQRSKSMNTNNELDDDYFNSSGEYEDEIVAHSECGVPNFQNIEDLRAHIQSSSFYTSQNSAKKETDKNTANSESNVKPDDNLDP